MELFCIKKEIDYDSTGCLTIETREYNSSGDIIYKGVFFTMKVVLMIGTCYWILQEKL